MRTAPVLVSSLVLPKVFSREEGCKAKYLFELVPQLMQNQASPLDNDRSTLAFDSPQPQGGANLPLN